MAWTRGTDYSSLLQSVKTWIYTSVFGVTGSNSSPTLTEAFGSDTVKATKFAHGMWRFNMNNGFAPTRNYVDALQTIQTETGSSFFGAGAKIAEDGHVWYSTDAAFTKSGDKCLVVRNIVSPTADDQLDLISAPFPVTAGQSYRISVRWTSDLAGTFMECGIRELDKDKAAIGLDSITAGIVTPGTMQWDSGVVTMGATTTFGVLDLLKFPTDPVWNYYIDEIRVDPIGGLVHRTSDNGQSIPVLGAVITFEDAGATSNSDVTYSAGTFTVVRPGDYAISASLLFGALADQVRYGIFITAGGRDYWGGQQTQSGANFGGSTVSATCRLERGDTITVSAWHLAAGAEALHTDGDFNYVTIKRID